METEEETTICDFCSKEIYISEAYDLDNGIACPDCWLDSELISV